MRLVLEPNFDAAVNRQFSNCSCESGARLMDGQRHSQCSPLRPRSHEIRITHSLPWPVNTPAKNTTNVDEVYSYAKITTDNKTYTHNASSCDDVLVSSSFICDYREQQHFQIRNPVKYYMN